MLLPTPVYYWSTILNVIVQSYLNDRTTVCMIWNSEFENGLMTPKLFADGIEKTFVVIGLRELSESFPNNAYDFETRADELNSRGLDITDLMLKLIVSIEITFCESYIVFQSDIPAFLSVFQTARKYASWHSLHNAFVFLYHNDSMNGSEFFQHNLFEVEPDILIVEAETLASSIFTIKTNRYIGEREQNAKSLYTANVYDAVENRFQWAILESLVPNKKINLQGKEVIFSSPSYPPYMVINKEEELSVRDHNVNNLIGAVHVDGTEFQVLLQFCEVYNCTIECNTSCDDDWGAIYMNATAEGCLELLINDEVMVTLGAYTQWDFSFVSQSSYLGHSDSKCLVPAPNRLNSWMLPFLPFQPTLWLGVFACLLVEILGLLVTRRAEIAFESGAKTNTQNSNWNVSLVFAYTTTLKLFISQGSSYVVNGISLRVLLFSCYMIDIIITSLYGGGLAAIITAPTLEEAPDSIERMVKYNLKWTGQSLIWTDSLIEIEEPLIKKLLANFYVSTFEEMQIAAETEFIGVVMEELAFGHFANINHLTRKAMSRLKLLIEPLYSQYTVAFVSRNWALQEEYNKFIHWWQAFGFLMHWEWMMVSKYMNVYNQRIVEASKNPVVDNYPSKLDITNFIGLLLVWAFGSLVSICIFFIESIYYKWSNNPKNRKQKTKTTTTT